MKSLKDVLNKIQFDSEVTERLTNDGFKFKKKNDIEEWSSINFYENELFCLSAYIRDNKIQLHKILKDGNNEVVLLASFYFSDQELFKSCYDKFVEKVSEIIK